MVDGEIKEEEEEEDEVRKIKSRGEKKIHVE